MLNVSKEDPCLRAWDPTLGHFAWDTFSDVCDLHDWDMILAYNQQRSGIPLTFVMWTRMCLPQRVIALVVFCQLYTVIWKEGTSIEELPLLYWPVGTSVDNFLDWWLTQEGSAHCRWYHQHHHFPVLKTVSFPTASKIAKPKIKMKCLPSHQTQDLNPSFSDSEPGPILTKL